MECEAVVTFRTICGWVKFMECGRVLYGNTFSQKLKGAAEELCKASNVA